MGVNTRTFKRVPIVQWFKHQTCNQGVVSLSPSRTMQIFFVTVVMWPYLTITAATCLQLVQFPVITLSSRAFLFIFWSYWRLGQESQSEPSLGDNYSRSRYRGYSFSALTLLVGRQEGLRPVKTE